MNKSYIEDLIQLMKDNPDMDVKCNVDGEIVCDDSYCGWWLGELYTNEKPYIAEYSVNIGEAIKFKSDNDYEEWFEEMFDVDDFKDVPDEEWDNFIIEKVDECANWEKAIFITITTFD